jgi:alpha-ribazole phosphatase
VSGTAGDRGDDNLLSEVFAIRHAPTLGHGACVGDADVPSVMSAEEAATRMTALVAGRSFAGVWSSPLSRCLAPARRLAGQLGLPLRADQRLREISLGIWQGKSWCAIEASDPARLRGWVSSWIDTAPPGGESALDLLARVRSWWRELPTGRHLLVAHAGVIRGLRVLVHGEPWPEAMLAPIPHLQGQWFSSSRENRTV